MQPKVSVSHILFILEKDAPENEIKFKRQKAKELHQLLLSGKDFAELAKKYSEDVSAHSGGSIGVMERGTMVSEFEEVAYKLKKNEFSDIVMTRYGLHIIKCDEILSGHSKTFNEVEKEIKSLLRFRSENATYQNWINKLKKLYKIKYKK